MKKVFKYLIALLSIGILCLVFALSPYWWTKYEVHRPAFVSDRREIVEFNGNIYSNYYTLKDGTFVKETEYNVSKMVTNDEYLFVEVNDSIYMVDKNYDVIYTFECETVFNSLAASENYLYCYLGETAVPKLYIFDLVSKEKTILDVSSNSMYTNDNDTIFIHGGNQIYVIDENINEFYGNSYANKKSIYYKNKIISFVSSFYSEILTIECEDKISEVGNSLNCFLGKIKCYDNDVYFELLNKSVPDDCMIFGSDCICNFKNTNVYKYNIETNETSKVYNLKEREFLIDFSDEYIVYYSDGKVYKNDEVIKNVTPIEEGEMIEIKGERTYVNGSEISWSTFAYYNDQLYYLFVCNL